MLKGLGLGTYGLNILAWTTSLNTMYIIVHYVHCKNQAHIQVTVLKQAEECKLQSDM